jgi:uncharacterized membrane protein
MSDAIALEQEHGDSDIKAKVVWILYVFGILLGLTSIAGLAFAYMWRGRTPSGSLFRNHFDGQIGLFWRTFFSSALSVVIYAMGMVLFSAIDVSIFMIQMQWAFTVTFYITIVIIYLYFATASIVGLLKAFGYRPYY